MTTFTVKFTVTGQATVEANSLEEAIDSLEDFIETDGDLASAIEDNECGIHALEVEKIDVDEA